MGNSNPSSNTLLCIVGEDFSCFGLLDNQGRIIESGQLHSNTLLENDAEALSGYLAKSLSESHYSQLKIGILNQWFSLIPKEVSDQEAEYWVNKPEDIDVDFHIDTLNQMKVAYYIPTILKKRLASIHQNVSFHHLISVNLQANESDVGVHSYKINDLQLLQVVNEQMTVYTNLIKSDSVMSHLYFSLLAFHLHNKDPHQVAFYTNNSDAELNKEFATYIKHINNTAPAMTKSSASNLTDENLYQLVKLDSCGS